MNTKKAASAAAPPAAPTHVGRNYVFDPDDTPPTERPLLEGILGEGDLALWVGREKHRKSSVILLFSVCLALGKPFLSFKTPAALRVVILDYESKPGSLKRRYDAICNSLGLTATERQQLRRNLHIVELRRYVTDGNNLPKFPAKDGRGAAPTDRAFWEVLVTDHPAGVYVIDPMRCLHAEEENDSAIEALLAMIRSVFKRAAVVIAHHMSKRGNTKDALLLKDDMRGWSDGARGSGAIKAHADVIICQEQTRGKDGSEVVYWGAFLKDAADIEPLALEETEHESFYWRIRPEVPDHLKPSLAALRKAKTTFKNKAEAAATLVNGTGMSSSTAYRHVEALLRCDQLETLASGVIALKIVVRPMGSVSGGSEKAA